MEAAKAHGELVAAGTGVILLEHVTLCARESLAETREWLPL